MKLENCQTASVVKRLSPKAGRRGQSKVMILLLTLSLLAAIAVGYKLLCRGSRARTGLSLLKKAYKAHRPIESRIAGFEYSPFLSLRGDREPSAPDTLALHQAERVLLDAVDDEPDARSHHALGVFHLLNKQFDEAIDAFEKAVALEPANASLQSDLSTALFEKGRSELAKERSQSQFTGKPLEYLSRSLEHIHKALDTDASLKEAAFNLGLIQEEFGLHFAARETFSKYLEGDADSGWSREALEGISRHDEIARASSLSKEDLLAEFSKAFARRDEDQAWHLVCENRSPLNGKHITELLVDAYINHVMSLRKDQAAESLSALSFLGALEVRRADEHYTEKLARFYRGQPGRDIAQLKQARELVSRGHDLYTLDRGEAAIAAYAQAKKIFDQLRDHCESLSTEYRIAFCKSEDRDTAGSRPTFERLAATSEKQKFKLLQVRNLLGIAADEFSRKLYSKAISHAFQSLEVARKEGDELSAFGSLSSLMEFYRTVGNRRSLLASIQHSFEYSSCPAISQLQSFGYFSRVASALLSAGYIDASLEFRKEASRFLMRDVARDAALYFADLGATYTRLKKYGEAEANLNLAYEEAKAVSPDPAKKLILAYVGLHKGDLHRDRQEFDDALSSYGEVLELSDQAQFPAYAYQAHKGRLYCYISLGDDGQAENEIKATLSLLEQSRSTILEQENRNSFFSGEQGIYDMAIDYQYSRRNNPDKAFEYSEESRSRSLLDLLRGAAAATASDVGHDIKFADVTPPLTLQEILRRLPVDVQVVQYTVLADKLIVWVLSAGQIASLQVPIRQTELTAQVKAYLGSVSHYSDDNPDGIRAQSKALHDILVKPLSHLLRPDASLCIVPDDVLNNLPFETLISAQTQRYLLEDFAVFYAPSASVLIECLEESQHKQALGPERLLGVGGPDFDRSVFKDLASLPDARREVKKIADYYPDPVILTADSAREQRVKQEMEKATTVHFATHSLPDEDSPLRSRILLSKASANPSPDDDGVLESREIYQARLPNTRLVVLSSCQSGIDRYYQGEGMMSLARSFLAAKVPTVVASLWEADSKATADLMIEFHRLRRQEKLSVAESLRRAKQHLLQEPGGRFHHPYFWSAFITIGGEASFDKQP